MASVVGSSSDKKVIAILVFLRDIQMNQIMLTNWWWRNNFSQSRGEE